MKDRAEKGKIAIKKGSSVKCVDAYHAMHIVLM